MIPFFTSRFLAPIAFIFFSLPLWAQGEHPEKPLSELRAAERQHAQHIMDFRSSAFTQDYDVVYHRLEWSINPQRYFIQGRVTTYFFPKESGFQQINFDFRDGMNVTSIRYRGQERPVEQPQGDRLAIDLPGPVPKGVLDSITVTYQGAPTTEGLGAFARTSQPGGTPTIWTLSQPYGARNWWPCKQSLNDKIDSLDIYVTVPQLYEAASNGILVSNEQKGPDRVFHWRHRHPIATYLIAVSVADYETYGQLVPTEDREEQILVLNYVYPSSLERARQQTEVIVPIMQLFNTLFGLYPYADEKYGHAEFGFGGGMEHQTISFMGSYSHVLQAHELAHQWFGDKVTCGSWQDIWLNEGFATYLEGLTYENGLGDQDWRDWLGAKNQSITREPGGSVFVHDTTSIFRIFNGRLSYDKGAMLLHMLRWKLGDDAFFQALRNYLNDPELAFGFARTADLQAHLETAGQMDLDEFFADWLYGEGYPNYQVRWSPLPSGFSLTLSQTTSHPSVDFYEMPVPLVFYGPNGESDTLVIDHTGTDQLVAGSLSFTPVSIAFDPDLWLVRGDITIDQATATQSPVLAKARVFPNPTTDGVQIVLPKSVRPTGPVRILNGQGRLVSEQAYRPDLSLDNLPAATYWLHLPTDAGILIKPVQKQ